MPAKAIPEIPIFQGLNMREREELNEWVIRREYEAGTLLIREGDADDGLYILAKGRASVMKHGKTGEVKIAEVEGPTVVGELGLLTRGPRAASVAADSHVIAGFIPARTFEDQVDRRNPIALRIAYNLGYLASLRLRAVLERVVELSEFCECKLKHDDDTRKVTRKIKDLKEQIMRHEAGGKMSGCI